MPARRSSSSDEPRPLSPMEHLVLRLLVERGAANGSRLCELDDTVTVGSVYKILERLRGRGYVESLRTYSRIVRRNGIVREYVKPVRGTRQPSFYRATPAGRRALISNDQGRWHVERWIEWCDQVGVDPVRSWKRAPGKKYIEARSTRVNPWQIFEAIDAWYDAQRAEQRAG